MEAVVPEKECGVRVESTGAERAVAIERFVSEIHWLAEEALSSDDLMNC